MGYFQAALSGCWDADVRGNLIPGTWFAALAIESGCEWITLDRDFAGVEGVRWGGRLEWTEMMRKDVKAKKWP